MAKILLTGASTGIGAAILDKVLEATSHDIVVVGRSAPHVSGRCSFVEADFRSIQQLRLVASDVVNRFGVFDVLINNSGVGVFRSLDQVTVEDWDMVLSVNLLAPFVLIQAVVPGMRKQGHGRVINISSDADIEGFPEGAVYCSSKHALAGMTKALRLELVGTGVKFSMISPGRVDTHFNGKVLGDRPLSLRASDVAAQIVQILNAPLHCDIESIRLRSSLE